jgi:hypothetical protein
MDYLLAGSRTRLSYLQDRRRLADIDWPTIFDDLADLGAPSHLFRWSDLDALTHVVLATDRATGRYRGIIGLVERAAISGPYLRIEAVITRQDGDGIALRRAMLAHILARITCLDGKPIALAAPRGDRAIDAALRDLNDHIGASEIHPPTGSNVVVLRTASLALQIGTGGSILDLRAAAEVPLLRELREMHGGRAGRLKSPIATASLDRQPMAKTAKPGTATRRPGTATLLTGGGG